MKPMTTTPIGTTSAQALGASIRLLIIGGQGQVRVLRKDPLILSHRHTGLSPLDFIKLPDFRLRLSKSADSNPQ